MYGRFVFGMWIYGQSIISLVVVGNEPGNMGSCNLSKSLNCLRWLSHLRQLLDSNTVQTIRSRVFVLEPMTAYAISPFTFHLSLQLCYATSDAHSKNKIWSLYAVCLYLVILVPNLNTQHYIIVSPKLREQLKPTVYLTSTSSKAEFGIKFATPTRLYTSSIPLTWRSVRKWL